MELSDGQMGLGLYGTWVGVWEGKIASQALRMGRLGGWLTALVAEGRGKTQSWWSPGL